jgi:hypothetical protein
MHEGDGPYQVQRVSSPSCVCLAMHRCFFRAWDHASRKHGPLAHATPALSGCLVHAVAGLGAVRSLSMRVGGQAMHLERPCSGC